MKRKNAPDWEFVRQKAPGGIFPSIRYILEKKGQAKGLKKPNLPGQKAIRK
jgi:hypothetical protein